MIYITLKIHPLEAAENPLPIPLGLGLLELLEPFQGNHLKGALRGLAILAGIHAIPGQRVGCIAVFPGIFQASLRVHPKGKAFLLPLEAISRYRPFSWNIRTVLFSGFASHMTTSERGKGATPWGWYSVAPKVAPKTCRLVLGFPECHRTGKACYLLIFKDTTDAFECPGNTYWRRERDSNPRWVAPRRFSRPVP